MLAERSRTTIPPEFAGRSGCLFTCGCRAASAVSTTSAISASASRTRATVVRAAIRASACAPVYGTALTGRSPSRSRPRRRARARGRASAAPPTRPRSRRCRRAPATPSASSVFASSSSALRRSAGSGRPAASRVYASAASSGVSSTRRLRRRRSIRRTTSQPRTPSADEREQARDAGEPVREPGRRDPVLRRAARSPAGGSAAGCCRCPSAAAARGSPSAATRRSPSPSARPSVAVTTAGFSVEHERVAPRRDAVVGEALERVAVADRLVPADARRRHDRRAGRDERVERRHDADARRRRRGPGRSGRRPPR